jgi:group I intron endonuclease
MGFIYLITCKIDGKLYVGQTINTVEDRWAEHLSKGRQMIYHQDSDPERLRKQGILQSHLYRAMAIHGLDNFSIEELEECTDEELNDKEAYWIETLDTLAPKGYNLMTGGGSNGQHSEVTKKRISQTKQLNVDNTRNPKLEGLPPYVSYRYNPAKGGEMIRINKHPKCPGKNFLVKEYGSFEATKAAVLTFFGELEKTDVVYSRPKIGGDEFKDMKGFSKIKNGYRVNVVRNGRNYDRKFISKNKTDDENKQAALEHYNDLMERLSQEN